MSEEFLESELIEGVRVLRPRVARLEDATALLVLEDELRQILEESGQAPPKVVLNLESIEYIITTALAKLMSYRAKILAQGGKMALCCVRPAIKEVMKITQFDRAFSFYESESEALADMGQANR